MARMDLTDPHALLGQTATDADGRTIGPVEAVFAHRATGRPQFAVVDVGRVAGLGSKLVPVPVAGARELDGGRLGLAHPRSAITHAPELSADTAELDASAEARINEHFGLHDPSQDTAIAPSADLGPAGPPAAPQDDEVAEVVRSEEQLVVGTERRATEAVRLHKHVVTEEVTVTVTVRREEPRVERIPVEEADRAAHDRPHPQAMEDGTFDVVLYAEEPVVQTRLVPVERVRVHRDVLVEERPVTETVRRERIEVEGDGAVDRQDLLSEGGAP